MPDDRPPPDDRLVSLDALAAELRWQSRCLSVIATVAVGALLYVLRPVLAPFVVAVFATVGLKPILETLQRRLNLGRAAAVATSFLLGVILIMALSSAIASSVQELSQNDAYQRSARVAATHAADLADWLGILPDPDPEPATPAKPPPKPSEATPQETDDPTAASLRDSNDDPDAAFATDEPSLSNPVSSVKRLRDVLAAAAQRFRDALLVGMVDISGAMGVVLIYMFFLLLGASDVGRPQSELWSVIESKLREYLVLKTFISLVTGLAVWLVLALFGVPLALLMGLLTFLLNYVPNFGPLITCLLPLPLIWLSPDLSLLSMLAASVLSCGVQLAGGNVVEPRLMGSSFDLHPIVVLLALMLWFALWGFVGMLLAVPMTAALKVVLGRVERTEPVARVLAGDLSAVPLGRKTVG
ncbi:MAG: AI-2E family transporter [Planctomycetota bacterium]